MLNKHSKVAIAQISLSVCILILLKFLKHQNESQRPQKALIPLVFFSLIRLSGAILTILLENDPSSVGLTIATLIHLYVGVIPLIAPSLGLIRTILAVDFETKRMLYYLIMMTKTAAVASIPILIAGGALVGNFESETCTATGAKLIQAGYIVFASILAIITTFQTYLWRSKSILTARSMVIHKALFFTIPFLAVRTVYALISAFAKSSNSKWNPLYGSAVLFACMAVLMESIVALIYLYIGLSISRLVPADSDSAPKSTDIDTGYQESGEVKRDYGSEEVNL